MKRLTTRKQRVKPRRKTKRKTKENNSYITKRLRSWNTLK